MSMPPRSRTGSGPLIAGTLIVAVIVIALVAVLRRRASRRSGCGTASSRSATRPRSTDRALSDASRCTTSCSTSRSRSSSLVEGVIVFTAFRYRRKPGDDELPPQTHGNNLVEIIWTVDPARSSSPFLFVLSWQTPQHGRRQVAHGRRPRPGGRRALPVAVRLPRRRRQPGARRSRCSTQLLPVGRGRRPGPAGRRADPDHLQLQDVIHAFYVPQVPVQARRRAGEAQHLRLHRRRRRAPTAASAPSCAARSTARCCSTSTPSDRPTFDAWLAEARSTKASATPPPAAVRRAVRRAAGQGDVVQFERQGHRRSRPTRCTAPAGAPFTIHFDNDDARPAQRRDQGRQSAPQVFKGDDHHRSPARPDYQVPALSRPATTSSSAPVHPNMTGTLTVQ